MDKMAFIYAVLGGIFMGSYPVPIKAQSVVEANVHPIVFRASCAPRRACLCPPKYLTLLSNAT